MNVSSVVGNDNHSVVLLALHAAFVINISALQKISACHTHSVVQTTALFKCVDRTSDVIMCTVGAPAVVVEVRLLLTNRPMKKLSSVSDFQCSHHFVKLYILRCSRLFQTSFNPKCSSDPHRPRSCSHPPSLELLERRRNRKS